MGKGAISPFPKAFSKGLFPRGVKRPHCVRMGQLICSKLGQQAHVFLHWLHQASIKKCSGYRRALTSIKVVRFLFFGSPAQHAQAELLWLSDIHCQHSSCGHSRGHIYYLIDMKFGQNVGLDEIQDKLHLGHRGS